MALIKCPECKKDISDKAAFCVHCGITFNKNTTINAYYKFYGVRQIEDTRFGKSRDVLYELGSKNRWSTGVNNINILACGISKGRAEVLLKYLVENGGKGEIFIDENSTIENVEVSRYIDVILDTNAPLMCPKCGSKAITTGQRGFSIVTGFWGSNKTVNRCGKCGYSWNP